MKNTWTFLTVFLVLASWMWVPTSSVSANFSGNPVLAYVARGSGHPKNDRPAPKAEPVQALPQSAAPAQAGLQASAAWAQSLPVQLDTLPVFSANFNGTERVTEIYLPGGYTQNPQERYPVLYVFDGQQLPQVNFQEMINELVAKGEMEPVIVVAVYSTEGDLRREELGAGPLLNFLGWGTQADAFNQFVVNELVPKVNSTYRTLTGPENTGVMGWSLGGLTAFYLAWQYPDTFGIVGAFSPSFWWRTSSPAGQELQARVIPNLVASTPARPGLRVWLEAGTAEQPYSDVDGNGVIDMIQDARDVRDLLLDKGYQAGQDVTYLEVEGGQHELSTWETVLPNFLHFAFPVG